MLGPDSINEWYSGGELLEQAVRCTLPERTRRALIPLITVTIRYLP